MLPAHDSETLVILQTNLLFMQDQKLPLLLGRGGGLDYHADTHHLSDSVDTCKQGLSDTHLCNNLFD